MTTISDMEEKQARTKKRVDNLLSGLVGALAGVIVGGVPSAVYLNEVSKERDDYKSTAEAMYKVIGSGDSVTLLALAERYKEVTTAPDYGKDNEAGKALAARAQEIEKTVNNMLQPGFGVDKPAAEKPIQEARAK